MELVLNDLLKQEDELQFNQFDSEDALQIGLSIIQIAKNEIKKDVAVHIEYDKYSLFTHYMKGTDEGNLYWVTTKKNVVKKYGHSSLYIGEMYKSQGTTFHKETGLSDQEYQAEGGSFPLILKEQGRVGTVTVSGLTGEEDHALAVEGIRRYLRK